MSRVFHTAIAAAKSGAKAVAETDLIDQIRLLTLVMLLAHPYQEWYMPATIRTLTIAGILFPSARKSSLLWFSLASVMTIWVYNQWFSVMNHDYLIAYWLTTLAFAGLLSPSEQRGALATSSRLLLGGVMALATFHKVISPSYTSGDFMEFILLCDRRFDHISWLIGGVDLGRLSANSQDVVQWVREGAGTARHLLIPSGGWRLNSLVWILTWGTVFVEGAIALAFLLPLRGQSWIKARAILMILFIALTYPIAPVVGFAWILVVLTLATLPADSRNIRLSLTVMFVVLPLVYLSPSKLFRSLFVNFPSR